ncbi:MAG: hypothetical protein AVDCRST_MAG56-1144, partial [uncultured Cytophagales bacterium]
GGNNWTSKAIGSGGPGTGGATVGFFRSQATPLPGSEGEQPVRPAAPRMARCAAGLPGPVPVGPGGLRAARL